MFEILPTIIYEEPKIKVITTFLEISFVKIEKKDYYWE